MPSADTAPAVPPERPAEAAARHGAGVAVPSAAVLLGAFALFTYGSEPGGSHAVDRAALRLASWVTRGPLHAAVDTVGPFGSPAVSLLLAAALAALLLARGRRPAAAAVLGALAVITLIEGLLRVRMGTVLWSDLPGSVLSLHSRHLMDSSYPSGHAARLMLLGGIAAVLLPRRLRGAGIAVALLVGAAVSVQRVHGGYHTGSDVAGGLLLGGAMAAMYAAVCSWTARARSRPTATAMPRAARPAAGAIALRRYAAPASLVLALVAVAVAIAAVRQRPPLFASNGVRTRAVVRPESVPAGGAVTITVSVTSARAAAALIDVEVRAPSGVRVFQQWFDEQALPAGVGTDYTVRWRVPFTAPAGRYAVTIGVFGPAWQPLRHWNDGATVVTVDASGD